MVKSLVLLSCLVLQGCAYYTLDITSADGTHTKGKAIVANNSDQVALNLKKGTDELTFGKVNTDGAALLDILRRALVTEAPSE